MGLSNGLSWVFGRWWLCGLLLVASLVIFTVIVPNAVSAVTAGGTLVPKILDQYYLTWTPNDARHFYEALGPQGRLALRNYYLHLDFWFPMLTMTLFYISFISLAFPPGTRWAWLNLTPIAMWASDALENLNHFMMAGSYPELSSFSLTLGPWFSGMKYGLMTVLLIPAIIAFAMRAIPRRTISA